MRYSRSELRALHQIFSYHAEENDIDRDENSDSPIFVYPSQAFDVITKLARNDQELTNMKRALADFQEQQQLGSKDPSSSIAAHRGETASDSSTIVSSLQSYANETKAAQIVAEIPLGCLTFDSFASIIDQGRQTQSADDDCHLDFLCIINDYQTRCDLKGKYLLAKDFMDHLSCLSKEEVERVVNKTKDKMLSDRARIVRAHDEQQEQFTQNWDEYLTRFEAKSQQYLTEMQETHEQQLQSLRKNLTDEIASKPKKWSRDLIEYRKSLANVAKQASTDRPSVPHTQLYREAQQIKQVTDTLYKREESDMNSKFDSVLSAKMRNLEKKQQAEIDALTKRIETKRREVTKKRENDTLRLHQRNRNIVKMIDTKNKLECSKIASNAQLRIKRVIKQQESQR